MTTLHKSEDADLPRRRFLGGAALTVAAAQFGIFGCANESSNSRAADLPPTKPGTNTSFNSLKQIDATFDRTAASFDNADHVAIVIHNYRWRLGLADGEPKYDDLEKRLSKGPVITVPTITLEGDANGAPHPDPGSYARKLTGKYTHRIIEGGVGHNLPQEAPQAFADAVVEVDGY